MNSSLIIFVLDDRARALRVEYDPDTRTENRLFKTIDPEIKVGDYVVVETNTRHGMTVCKVVEDDVIVNPESHTEMNWIVGRVDYAEFKRLQEWEKGAIRQVQKLESERKRKQLYAEMFQEGEDAITPLALEKD